MQKWSKFFSILIKTIAVVFVSLGILTIITVLCLDNQVNKVQEPNTFSTMLSEALSDSLNDTRLFVPVAILKDSKIVYHRDTKVLYAVSTGYGNKGTYTLLVNQDGSPMIYEENEEE